MIKTVELDIFPKNIEDLDFIKKLALKKLKILDSSKVDFRISRRSIDARGRRPLFKLRCELSVNGPLPLLEPITTHFKKPSSNKEVLIIGAGPAGYFAALEAIKQGLKPIVLDRGKDVQARRRDLKAIQQDGIVHPHSNYCFGEGGAGTYSDGKLYTRSQKRGNIQEILQILVEHGASTDILMDAHPHIGSNKLPKIVAQIRETILSFGGQVLFDKHVVDLYIKDHKISGASCTDGSEYLCDQVVLATGHSSRDIYLLLDAKGVTMTPKDFALGVRIEHPQPLIDHMQYGQSQREDNLPASSYSISCQIQRTGVFSFCMCPGGLIVPAATAPGELVVNGMSLSRRDSPYANSGFVTSIYTSELERHGYKGLFGNLDFQRQYEQAFFNAGDGSQKAPAQRVTDFTQGIISKDLNPTSYIPGVYSAPVHELLPDFVYRRLSSALKYFEYKVKGYYTEEAQVIGLESRTSSPVTIIREEDTLMHPDVKGLYPCGEGAGFAGGILSACMDGQRVIRALAKNLK